MTEKYRDVNTYLQSLSEDQLEWMDCFVTYMRNFHPELEELSMVMQYAKRQAKHISLFGCSLGAYFSLLAYRDEPLQQTMVLSLC